MANDLPNVWKEFLEEFSNEHSVYFNLFQLF